jgi:hypothetical protein
MKKDIAKKWVKALRSGKYKQGQSWLKQYDKKGQERHCCLGVLCELYNDEMKKKHKKSLNSKIVDGCEAQRISFNKQEQGLPSVVKKWAGMKDSLGYFVNTNREFSECLADMNDIGVKFKTIANTIEKNIENI